MFLPLEAQERGIVCEGKPQAPGFSIGPGGCVAQTNAKNILSDGQAAGTPAAGGGLRSSLRWSEPHRETVS